MGELRPYRERLNEEQRQQFQKVTAYFEEHDGSHSMIEKYLSVATNKKKEMAREIARISIFTICTSNIQVHILNDSFRSCLDGYNQWRTHAASEDRSLCIKMHHNLQILLYQKNQMDIYLDSSNCASWKKELDDELTKIGYDGNFLAFFFGMFYPFDFYIIY